MGSFGEMRVVSGILTPFRASITLERPAAHILQHARPKALVGAEAALSRRRERLQ